jgi:sulfur carrier protein
MQVMLPEGKVEHHPVPFLKFIPLSEMEISVNNEPKIIHNKALSALIKELLGDNPKGIAVAVNQTIVPKSEWNSTSLREKDAVLIIKATQGG